MDKISKFLARLTPSDRHRLAILIERLLQKDLAGLDIKKLRNAASLFRVRDGKIRIIFRQEGATIILVDINFRKDVYKHL